MSKSKALSRRAYSYVRFSHPKQAEGGSLERQLRLTEAYCKRKGLVLDESLTLLDLGVSAFRGANVEDGALGAFLEACRIGRVPRGSYLILENLDRLSRSQIRPALKLFFQVQDYGITIVTHEPEREYRPEDSEALALIEPLIIFARAHEESVMKSHRRKDGWRQARDKARQGGGPMLRTCPAWLEVTPDGFRVKEDAAAVVRRIFDLARDGLGVHRTTELLVREGVPPIGTRGRWVKAYVYRILTNPAAMGTYQPMRQEGKKVVPDGDPIPSYYPKVVEEAEWQQAQAALLARGGGFTRGRRASPAAGRKGDQETNLFTGLVYSATTRERMHITHAMGRKGDGERKRYVYLYPTRETGVPNGGPRLDYATFEAAILSRMRELKPSDIVGDKAPGAGKKAEAARLSGRLLDIDNKLERARQRARTSEDFDSFLDLIQDLQNERKQVSERLAELEEQDAGHPAADLGETHTLIDLLAQTPPEQREELRRRLKARIRLLVAEMWVLIVAKGRDRLCAVQMYFRSGKHRDYVVWHRPGKSYGKGRAEAHWEALSSADVQALGALDLRKHKHAAKLERALAGLDLDG
jgi:DNA invertase Pin-like site-specific DNA recombinase